MVKGTGLYARDVDIGKPGITQSVDVKNFSEVVTVLNTAIEKLSDTVAELEKLTLGLSVTTGEDLNKEV